MFFINDAYKNGKTPEEATQTRALVVVSLSSTMSVHRINLHP
jgi:hypothetical protein